MVYYNKYFKIKKEELIKFIYFSAVLSFLFSTSYLVFFSKQNGYFELFIKFFIFLFVLLYSRFYFMKYLGYRNAFDLKIYEMHFDRYWIREWDRLSYWIKNKNFKGIPLSIISILIYILSLGVLVYPNLWNYKLKKIPHLHLGTRQRYEYAPELIMVEVMEISDWRYSKILVAGFFYYLLFGFFLKFLNSVFIIENYEIYLFILFWIAFFSIIPFFGSEGFELWIRNSYAWTVSFTIIFWGMLSLIVFSNIIYSLLIFIFSSILILSVFLWRKFIK